MPLSHSKLCSTAISKQIFVDKLNEEGISKVLAAELYREIRDEHLLYVEAGVEVVPLGLSIIKPGSPRSFKITTGSGLANIGVAGLVNKGSYTPLLVRTTPLTKRAWKKNPEAAG